MSLKSPGMLVPGLELRNALARHLSSSTPRDRDLLQQVVGAGGTEQGYLYGGFMTATGIRAALRAIGRDIYQFNSILDFGCGSARVLRWFQDVQPAGRLYGCDINAEAIQWCVGNAAFAEFTNSAPLPPLPYADHSFDLIFGISVFTHLDEHYQLAWLSELRRIVKPGGVVLMTVHGSDKALRSLSSEEYDSFERSGFLYQEAIDRTSTKGLPDFYQVAYHAREYIERVWSEFFDIAAYLKHGCMYSQDLIVMQTRGASTEQRTSGNQEILTADLPIASLDEPAAGAWLLDEQIHVKGWAFYPSGNKVELDIGIDEQIMQRCSCTLERQGVAESFSDPGVLNSGFEAVIPAEGVGKGWHTLWISVRGNPFPLSATYFYRPSVDSVQDDQGLIERLVFHQHEVRDLRQRLAAFERETITHEGQIRDLRQNLAASQHEAAIYAGQARELRDVVLARDEAIVWMETQVADGRKALEWRIHEVGELSTAKHTLETVVQQTCAALNTANNQLDEIRTSKGWQLAIKLRLLAEKLFPWQSARGRLLRKIF